jgi:hypothetical protein
MTTAQAPFSARNRGTHRKVDNDFPPSARIGLLHLLFVLSDRDYIGGWATVARELQRIGRVPPVEYDASSVKDNQKIKNDVEQLVLNLAWDKALDFCERLHSYLAQDVTVWNSDDRLELITPKAEVQKFISDDLQRLFYEEELAFEFSDGVVRRQGRRHTVDLASRAQMAMGDLSLNGARKHYEKAMQFFRHPSNPDYENCVKEAVCAVEAAGKALFPNASAATLGDLSKWLKNTREIVVPNALTKVIDGIYGYRSGGDGVGHGGAMGGVATSEVAELILAICASLIIFLVDVCKSQEPDVPF